MIIKCFSFSFNRGGAAIAAKNISLLAKKFADVKCYCADSSTIKDIDVVTPGRFEKYGHFFKRVISRLLLLLMNDHNNNKHSLNMFSSKTMVAALQEQVRGDSTVSHIHWIANDAISIFDLEKLPKNTLISLHDEWFYMGTEHVSMNNPVDRFKDGYEYRPSNLIGIDLNKIAWKQKYKIFSNRNDVIVTAPSSWMVNRAKESLMFRNNEIRLLPNPIDTECFSPIQMNIKLKLGASIKLMIVI